MAAATLPLLEPILRPWETGRDSHSKAAEKQIVPKSPDWAGCPCKQQPQGSASLSWLHPGQGWAQQELSHSSSIPSLWPVHLQVEHLYSEQRIPVLAPAGGLGRGKGLLLKLFPFQSARKISLFVREHPGWPLGTTRQICPATGHSTGLKANLK